MLRPVIAGLPTPRAAAPRVLRPLAAGIVLATLAVAVGPLLAAPLAAQRAPIPLDTIPVVGSRVSADLSLTTRNVRVWTRGELERLPARTIQDVLGWSLGVDLAPRSSAQADVSLRGAGFEQVLVLVDGVRMSDPQTGHFDLDLAVPLEGVERIEILRGPAAALYGSDAVGGVINVVTRTDLDWDARLEGGSFGSRSATVGGGAPLPGGARVRVTAEQASSDGHREGTDWRRRLAAASVRAPVAGGRLIADLGNARRAFGAEDFYAPFPSFETTRTRTASLAWRPLAADGIRLEPRLSWRRHDDDFILDRADPAFYRNRHASSQLGGELVARAMVGRATLSAGAEAARHTLESNALGDRDEDRRALFAEAALRPAGDVDAVLGLRWDDHDRWGGFVSPSAGVSVEVDPRLRLRASAGRSFRGPSWTERHYEDPAHQASEELRPERSTSAEVGADLTHLDRGLRLGLTYFSRQSRDLIDWARPADDEEALWETTNVNEARFQGVEAEVRWTVDAETVLEAGAALLSLESDAAPGLESKYALRPLAEQFHLGVTRELPFGARAAARATRARRVGEGSYGVLDLRLEAPVPGGRIHLDGLNLTGSDHLDLTGNPVAGRAFYLGLRVGG